MFDEQSHTPRSLPISNYGSAIARAVEWLGDRYLLANPINANSLRRQSLAADYRHRGAIAPR